MSSLYSTDEGMMLYTKGAIDVLLDRSTSFLTADGPVPMTPELRRQVEQVNREQSENGLRILAFAQRPMSRGPGCSPWKMNRNIPLWVSSP